MKPLPYILGLTSVAMIATSVFAHGIGEKVSVPCSGQLIPDESSGGVDRRYVDSSCLDN